LKQRSQQTGTFNRYALSHDKENAAKAAAKRKNAATAQQNPAPTTAPPEAAFDASIDSSIDPSFALTLDSYTPIPNCIVVRRFHGT